MATIAVFLALGGGAYAISLPRNSVKSRNIKNGQVRTRDLADRAVSVAKTGRRPVARIDTPRDDNGIGGCDFDQEIPDSAAGVVPLLFTHDTYDPNGMHPADASCQNGARSKLTVRTSGYYDVRAGALWYDQNPDAGLRFIGIRVNGTNDIAGVAGPPTGTDNTTMQNVGDVVHLKAGDYLQVVARTHDATAPGGIKDRSVYDPRTFLAVDWIGP